LNRDKKQRIYEKYQGHCAYCGKNITTKEMHVDHIIPKFRWIPDRGCFSVDGRPFTEYSTPDDERNLNPACPRCNLWKTAYTIEEFRREIAAQVGRLRLRAAGFRLAEDFTLIVPGKDGVTFYFENHT